jgi:hypothetical protein
MVKYFKRHADLFGKFAQNAADCKIFRIWEKCLKLISCLCDRNYGPLALDVQPYTFD